MEIEILEKIIEMSEFNIPYYAYGDNQAACEMADRLVDINNFCQKCMHEYKTKQGTS